MSLPELRQAEVEQLGDSVVAEEGVRGLDVAVKDAGRVVRGGEAAREVDADRDDLGREGAASRASSRPSAGKYSVTRNGRSATSPDVMDREDVRVLHARDGARLDRESAREPRPTRGSGRS